MYKIYFWDNILKQTLTMNRSENSAKKIGDARKENLEKKFSFGMISVRK